ncbi:MAG: hypothetical protein KBF88_02645 [Polyangiaceae bacterium]|nr:hypothetical protein [Polyangiaceae bacterium]
MALACHQAWLTQLSTGLPSQPQVLSAIEPLHCLACYAGEAPSRTHNEESNQAQEASGRGGQQADVDTVFPNRYLNLRSEVEGEGRTENGDGHSDSGDTPDSLVEWCSLGGAPSLLNNVNAKGDKCIRYQDGKE